MENFIFSLNVVLPLFIMMCLGAFLRKINIFNDDFLNTANSFTFKVLLPVLLFYSIYKSEISETVNVKFLGFAVCVVFVTIGLLFLIVPKLEKDKRNIGVIIQGLYRSNFVLFGIPLCTNIFGEAGLGVTSTLIAIIVPVYNFTAVIILDIYSKDKLEIKETVIGILKNPLIIGSVIGILVSSAGLKMPSALEKTVSDISKMATPLALMVLGGEFKISNVYKNLKYIAMVTAGKLFIIPPVVVAVAVALGYRGAELGALFCMVAPPVSVSSYTMAQQSQCNYELAGQIVFMTTLFSSISIFIFVFTFKSIGLF